jgi:hypothetical protein
MAKGLQDYTVDESTAPYIKAVEISADTAYDPCRAVYAKTAAAHQIYVAGVEITFTGMLAGHIYPICATQADSANLVFLY